MAQMPPTGPPSGGAPAPSRSWLGRIDSAIYYFERGIVVVTLLTLAIAYFFDIVSVEVASADNAFDRVIYRFAGFGDDMRPDEAFRNRVHGTITPIILGTLTWILAYLAVIGQPSGRTWPLGRKLLASLGIVAGIVGVLAAIAYLPPMWVCAVTWVAFVLAYGWRAKERGGLIPYLIAWIPGVPIYLWLFSHIDEGYAWAQDLGKVLIMWIGFLGASMATRDRKHIRIDFVRKALGPKRTPVYNAVSYFVTIIFCGIMAVLAIAYFYHDLDLGGTLTSIPIPLNWIVAPIACTLIMMVFRFSGRMVLALRGLEGELGGEGELPAESASRGGAA